MENTTMHLSLEKPLKIHDIAHYPTIEHHPKGLTKLRQ
jgi:hypothetical protein